MFARFFIDRPVSAIVLSLLILLAGSLAIWALPIERYPSIAPPSINISASYSGADAQTVADSVATPIEQQLSRAKGLLYFNSRSTNDGSLNITATFEIGTDQDLAAVEIQNAVSAAQARLPEEVIRGGVTVSKASTSLLAVVALESTDPRYDDVFLSNYAIINVLNELRRVPGVGDVSVFGSKTYAMRVWLNPDRLAALNMTVSDVVSEIRDQNSIFPTGAIGQEPTESGVALTIPLVTRGRLEEAAEFRKIVLRAYPDGRMVRLEDVARVELGSYRYQLIGRLNGQSTAMLLVSLQNDANALSTIDGVKRRLDELSSAYPPGVSHVISYDTTTFIDASIREVVKTLLEAVLLVVLVVFLFLQSWRVTLIPLLAIPVSIVGAFAGMLLLGYTINTLTLFGLVLCIGIVVDDAIIVVENVERVMREEGLSPRDATIRAMDQISGALIAMVLVLAAVFVPVTMMGGMTGQLYRQFAVTIAISVSISGLVALTLTPALCRLLLRPHAQHERKFVLFRWFDAAFERVSTGYTAGVRGAIRNTLATVVLFAGLGAITYRLADSLPTGFLPQEDEGSVLVSVLLPDGASLERTDAVARRIETFLQDHPAVANTVLLGGYDTLTGGANSTNAAALFVTLRPFAERRDPALRVPAVIDDITRRFRDDIGASVLAYAPPAVQGLGQRAGFQMELIARGNTTPQELADVARRFLTKASSRPELTGVSGTLRLTSPQLFVDLDRERAKALGVNVGEVFRTLQAYTGSLYVNDFNMFGRIWRIEMQADSPFRNEPGVLDRFFVRSQSGAMVPLSALVSTEYRAGPTIYTRFNGYPSIQITGTPTLGLSSGEAMAVLREIANDTLPPGFDYDWSGASYQEIRAGNQAPVILLFGLIVVFLLLAALYERWTMPMVVLLSVPFAIFGSLVAILARGLPQDIYFQVGLLVLVGLAAKNAILVLEFCIAKRREGMLPEEAALAGARIRFRPIVMTSLAFVFGVLPLALATGAGAAARHSIGTGVIGGMLASTFLATIFIPAFYTMVERATARRAAVASDGSEQPALGQTV